MSLIGFDKRDLDRILGEVSQFAETIYGKEIVCSLPLLPSIFHIKKEQDRIKRLQEVVRKTGYYIPFIDDIRLYLQRSEKVDFLTEEEAGFIYSNILSLLGFFEKYGDLGLNSFLDKDFDNVSLLKELKLDLAKYLTERGNISPSSSPELLRIIEEKEFLRQGIQDRLEKILSTRQQIFQDRYYTIRDGRYVLPLKANFKKDLKGTIRDTSQSGDTLFVEPEAISELNDKYVLLEKREEIEKRKILTLVTKKIKDKVSYIREGLLFLGYIDSLMARVRYLLRYDLNFPDMGDNKGIYLNNAYHPLFIQKSDVVKNDFIMGGDKEVFLITGPNGGGKTVSIKTISMIIVLSHIAIPVPISDRSYIPYFSCFCFDMEDRQSIDTGVSSFTSKMLLWKEIMNNISPDTIAFVDELGNFTNPQEGAAISIAFIDEIINRGGRIIAGTHLDEIKEYVSTRRDGIVSSMIWDEKLKKPTYKISYGTYSGSFAIEVLKELGFDKNFIKKCEDNLSNDYIYIEELKRKREREYLEVLKVKEEIDREKKELEKLILEREATLKKLKDEKYELLLSYKKEMEALKERIEREIKSLPKDPKLAREFFKAVSKQSEDTIKKLWETEIIEGEEKFNVGDEVLLIGLNERGKIIEIDGDNYNVLSGRLKIWVDKTAIRKIDKKIGKEIDISRKKDFQIYTDFFPEIDVRGKRVDEAIELIDKFLDRALLAGAKRAKIIHGAGEGKLRENIHKYLKENLIISSFKLGDIREPGGSYYTVVEIK